MKRSRLTRYYTRLPFWAGLNLSLSQYIYWLWEKDKHRKLKLKNRFKCR